VAARYIFLETFYDAPFINPPDKELYFNSFGIGELMFPLNEAIWRAAASDISMLADFIRRESELDEHKQVEVTESHMDEIRKRHPATLPHYSNYQWEKVEPHLKDFRRGPDLAADIKNFFRERQKDHDRKVRELYAETPLKNPYIVDLRANIEKLMGNSFYGYTASTRLLQEAEDEIEASLEKILSWNPAPPTREEYDSLTGEMKEAVQNITSFPMIVFAFLFIIIPFDKSLYDFLTWHYPDGDFTLYKILIVAGSILLSAGGAYIQKILMEGTLKETFNKYAACIQEFHRVHYYKTVKNTIETFYLEMKQLVSGVDSDDKKKIRPEIRETLSIRMEIEKYREVMERAQFSPEIGEDRFFNALLVIDPKKEKELDPFFMKFLSRPFNLGDQPDSYRKCSHIFEEVNQGLPTRRDILASTEKRDQFFQKMFENRYRMLWKKIENLDIDLWKFIEKMESEYFLPTASNLENTSSPLAKLEEHDLRDEANIMITERSIFLHERGKMMKSIEEYSKKKQFKTVKVEFLGDNILFMQTSRFVHIYKLSNLNDWKYYEERLEPDEKRRLYANDIFLNAPDIDYSSRTGREMD